MQIVEVHYPEQGHIANVMVADNTNYMIALEGAYRLTQNIFGSWSRGIHFEDGSLNEDYSPQVEVLIPLKEIDGKIYGHRSSMMGDIFKFDGKTYEVDFCGFKEVV